MATNSAIEWTDATWDPTTGCSIVSPGCTNCYAMRMAGRLEAMRQPQYAGTTKGVNGLTVWTGKLNTVEHALTLPMKWKKPRRVFVNSMSDLFHEAVPFDYIDRVFAVMALTPQHAYQILTKRPERMAEYTMAHDVGARWNLATVELVPQNHGVATAGQAVDWTRNGLPNVWLGTSVEDQKRADERIPHLLKCPAAVRFLSCEPLLGPVNLMNADGDGLRGGLRGALHWVIVGGESGHRARPCNVEWLRELAGACKTGGVACFVKQLGANVVDQCRESTPDYTGWPAVGPAMNWETGDVTLKDSKGGDINEFPEGLRVRQFPTETTAARKA